jgi:hypothetical protein
MTQFLESRERIHILFAGLAQEQKAVTDAMIVWRGPFSA